MRLGIRVVIQEYSEDNKCFDTLDYFEIVEGVQNVFNKINVWKRAIAVKYNSEDES